MPNYTVTFENGKTMTVYATDKEAAATKARKKYAAKKGRAGRVRNVS